MRKVSESEYLKYVPLAKANTANRVYPCSIAEGFQSGDIYVNEGADVETVLFWHYCGFAYISGTVSEIILQEMVNSVCQQDRRRMLLITDADLAIRFFRQKGEEIGRRIEYEYAGQIDSTNMNIDIRKIDSDNIHTITGRIIPSFSWKETEFLENGCGYIAFDHERYCGTAFSAAVSSEEIDVGVEVDPDYRGRGIATTLVQKMCVEAISQGKKPVWAHAATNAGSLHTALRCGFIRKKENSMIRLKQAE